MKEFTWQRPRKRKGFMWVTARPVDLSNNPASDDRTRALLPKRGAEFLPWHPMDHAVALYRELAAVPLTEKAVLAFANRYGRLGEGGDGESGYSSGPALKLDKPPEAGAGEPNVTETFFFWKKTIEDLSETITLWDWVQATDIAGLSTMVSWQDQSIELKHQTREGGVYAEGVSTFIRFARQPGEPLPFLSSHGDPLQGFQVGDILGAGILAILWRISQKIYTHAGPRLFWEAKKKRAVRRDLPDTLHAAIWLQFANAVADQTPVKRCKECNRLYEMKSRGARPNREFCSGACRAANYRKKRQDEARGLHLEGKTIEEIAEKLDSDVETVKQWVQVKKEE